MALGGGFEGIECGATEEAPPSVIRVPEETPLTTQPTQVSAPAGKGLQWAMRTAPSWKQFVLAEKSPPFLQKRFVKDAL